MMKSKKEIIFLFIITSLLLSTIISINSDYALANNQERRRGIDVEDSEAPPQPEESTDEENNGDFISMPFSLGGVSFIMALIITLIIIAWLIKMKYW